MIHILTALAVSLVASFCIAANTHAAGTADVKTVFGAVGDGVTDDTDAIQAAFDSDYDVIEFPKGEYKFTDQLSFAKGDKKIIGEKAMLFTDNDYAHTGPANLSEFGIVIRDANNITIEGMRFEVRQSPKSFWVLIAVLTANNIHFYNDDFQVSRRFAGADITGVDFYTGWHNVSVENCQFGMPRDDSGGSGGAVLFRDIHGQSASGGKFINNVIYKYTRDETIWIRGAEWNTSAVSDIEISGNRIYFGDSVDGSANVYTVALKGYSSGQLQNIRIHDNEIIGQGSGSLFVLESAENVEIFGNDLYTLGGALFGSREEVASPNTPGTTKIRNNRTITLDSKASTGGRLTRGANPYDVIDNPRIVINASSDYLIDHKGSFVGNDVTVNGNVYRSDGGGIISGNTKDVRNNKIYINGYADTFIRNWRVNLTAPATYTGNTITTTKKRPQADGGTSSINMWSFSMNGHPMTFSGNTFINGSEVENDESLTALIVEDTGSNTVTDRTANAPYSMLWSIQTTDAAPSSQTVYICNNVFKGFRTKRTSSASTVINLNCDDV